MNLEGFITEDGSSSLLNVELNETYHSSNGAITESEHVYIRMGLDKIAESKTKGIKILEVGFGTGLNVILTAIEAKNKQLTIDFTTIESYPVELSVLNKLNFAELLAEDITQKIHNADWGIRNIISEYLSLIKFKTSLESFESINQYDIIYFDAFSPSKQPEIWELSNLKKLKKLLVKSGILVTYCAQGQFRRNLETIGLKVERLSGPPGKFEMIRATKQ